MSAAQPMGNRRALAYIAARPDAESFTPRQSRRMSRKAARQANRAVPGWKPRGAKGKPTLRRVAMRREYHRRSRARVRRG